MVLPSIESAVALAQENYALQYTTETISTQLSKNSSLVIMNPFQASSVNIYPFSIGIKPFISTVGFVFPGLIQFFFCMALGRISGKSHLHARYSTTKNYFIRLGVSRLFSFMIVISWAGWLYCFAEGRTGEYKHSYILITLNMWVYTMISFEFHDSCTSFLPIEILPITLLSWVTMNVTTAAFPIPLKPVFYHFDYAVPSYNVLSYSSPSSLVDRQTGCIETSPYFLYG